MRGLKYPYTMLRFAPSMRCNFNCSYCTHFQYQKDIKEKTGWDEVFPDVWLKHLSRLEPQRDLRLVIGVGEPTLYDGIEDIVNGVTYQTSLYTNASDLAMSKIKRFKHRDDLQIYVSYHPTSGMSVEHFIENAKIIQERFKVLDFHSVPAPGEESKLVPMRNRMAEEGITLRVNHPYTGWDNGKLYFYDKFGGDQARFRDRFAGRLTGETKDVLCKVSQNHYADNLSMSYPIAPNGDIYTCWRYFLAGSKEGILGNFFDEDFEYNDNYFECSKYGDCNICGWDRNIVDKETGRQLDNDIIEREYV